MARQFTSLPSGVSIFILSKIRYRLTICSHNTFASAGGDGTVSIWDHTAKKRLRQYPKYALGVQDVAFNLDGSRLAIGVSYGWENGPEQAAKSVGTAQVFIREMGDEVKVCAARRSFRF